MKKISLKSVVLPFGLLALALVISGCQTIKQQAQVTEPANHTSDSAMGQDEEMSGDETAGDQDVTNAMPADDSMVDEMIIEEGAMDTKGGVPAETADESAMEQEVKTFSLDGFNFGFSDETITVNEGDKVKIILTSTDGFHDWVVDEFGAATTRVQTGGVTEVEFVADKAGTFEYYCSVGTHKQLGMIGKLIVK